MFDVITPYKNLFDFVLDNNLIFFLQSLIIIYSNHLLV